MKRPAPRHLPIALRPRRPTTRKGWGLLAGAAAVLAGGAYALHQQHEQARAAHPQHLRFAAVSREIAPFEVMLSRSNGLIASTRLPAEGDCRQLTGTRFAAPLPPTDTATASPPDARPSPSGLPLHAVLDPSRASVLFGTIDYLYTLPTVAKVHAYFDNVNQASILLIKACLTASHPDAKGQPTLVSDDDAADIARLDGERRRLYTAISQAVVQEETALAR